MKILSIGGGYWTGSGAVVDLLHEHENCLVVDGEFSLFSFGQFFQEITSKVLTGDRIDPKKLEDCIFRYDEFNRSDYILGLRSILRRFAGIFDLYPRRFCSMRFNGAEKYGDSYMNYCSQFSLEINNYLNSSRSISSDRLKRLFSQILNSVFYNAGETSSKCSVGVFDQLVGPSYAIDALKLDPSMKFIFVDRNWRDQYTEIRDLLMPMLKKNISVGLRPISEDYNDHKLDRIDYFIKLRRRLSGLRLMHEMHYSSNILWLDFEDFVNNTASIANSIFDFIEVPVDGWQPDKVFRPDMSMKNIEKWKSSPFLYEIRLLEKYDLR